MTWIVGISLFLLVGVVGMCSSNKKKSSPSNIPHSSKYSCEKKEQFGKEPYAPNIPHSSKYV
jgi:hypothetical protein